MAPAERRFEALGAETIHAGPFYVLERGRFRYPDGREVVRDVVRHPGAVGVACHDGEALYLVRQPREAVGDPDSLEIPAGRLERGERVLETARRELAEEIGRSAARWQPLRSYRSSVGLTDEEVHLLLATDLSEATAVSGEDERIEVVRWPLSDLDGALEATQDAKTIIALLVLRERLRA